MADTGAGPTKKPVASGGAGHPCRSPYLHGPAGGFREPTDRGIGGMGTGREGLSTVLIVVEHESQAGQQL